MNPEDIKLNSEAGIVTNSPPEITEAHYRKLMEEMTNPHRKMPKTIVSPKETLTYADIVSAEKAIQGIKNPFLPENWSIIKDPSNPFYSTKFYSTKLYHHDRLMKVFNNSRDLGEQIDEFIKEYIDGTRCI